jgi:zinc/manganese transport system ATP-binding protein
MLAINNLTLGYDKHPVVHHLNAVILKGDSVAIIGPNGGGKSTLLKGIANLISPLEGTITKNVANSKIAYLPQKSTIDKNFPISTFELVATGLIHNKGWFKKFNKEDYKLINNAIHIVGLEGFKHKPLCVLSGGQLQRALFARLILQNAELILLDEPFNAIDTKTSLALLDIINLWKSENRTIISVLHNYSYAKQYFSKTLILAREIVAFGDTNNTLVNHNIEKAFSMTISPNDNAQICKR